MRWLETGVFYPYCRTHVEYDSPSQEPWSYGNREEEINRSSIELRYRLLPYLYNAFRQNSETGIPVMRALLLDYPDDPAAVSQDYEFLFGDDLLVSPVVKQGRTRWQTYLPKGDWYDFWTGWRYTGPTGVSASAPLDHVPLYVRAGAILPTRPVVQYVSEAPIDPLTFEIYPLAGAASSRDYYEDDGISFDFEHGVSLRQKISVQPAGDAIDIRVTAREGSYSPPARALIFKIHAERQEASSVTAGGQTLDRQSSSVALEKAATGWAYDEAENTIAIKVRDSGAETAVHVALGGGH
jgi:alpha-glucosidase